jgi:protein TonB
MEAKKTKKADLQNKKSLFFQIGLCVALLAMIGVFSWSQPEVKLQELDVPQEFIEQEMVEITRPEPPKIPENAAPRLQVTSDILNIVRDDKKIEAELTWADIDESIDFTFDAGLGGGTYEGPALDDEPVFGAEEAAVFSGGDFSTWMQKQVGGDNYPIMAQENGIQGRVSVKFVVERDGSLSGIEVLSSPERVLSEAVIAAIKKSPKWSPAKNRGVAVRSWFTLPVDFQLR